MSKEKLIKVCDINALNEKQGLRFVYDKTEIAIFKINGEIFAVSNICPHHNTPIMYDGFLKDKTISCPYHGWQFDLKNGKCLNAPKDIKNYTTQIIDDNLYIKV